MHHVRMRVFNKHMQMSVTLRFTRIRKFKSLFVFFVTSIRNVTSPVVFKQACAIDRVRGETVVM